MSARSMLPRYHARHAARGRGPAAPPARGPVFRLDYATWHAHLASRPQPPVPAAVPSRIVPLDAAAGHAHPDGVEAVADAA